MARIGEELINKTKAEASAASAEDGVYEKSAFGGRRDLMTLLIRANMATDLPDSQRLSDDEVISQIPTFIVAGEFFG